MEEAVVVASDLVKKYGDFVAVDGIEFEVRRGQCFGFLGPNGAGKTTTMRMVYRALPVTAGTLRILGHDAAGGREDRSIKQRIGVVPQEDNLDQELSVREQLEVFARFYGLARREAAARIDAHLDFLGLAEKSESRVRLLSGGLKRRTQIARGLLGDPDILVLDEPTTGLDPQARQDLWERLNALKRRKATLLLTTHYMEEAERLCDRLVIIDRGKIVAEGTPQQLLKDHVRSHVVEIRIHGEVPEAAKELLQSVPRHEVLSERVLLYTDDGEALITKTARRLPDHRSLLRRSTLEDVFLKITGRALD